MAPRKQPALELILDEPSQSEGVSLSDVAAEADAEEQARLQAEEEASQRAANIKLMEELGTQFSKEFDEAKVYRQDAERRWIDDLRAFKGQYSPDMLKRLKDKKRSKLFLRLGRAKVKSLDARLGDMLFPAGDKNWSISATPVPEVDLSLYEAEISVIAQRDGAVDPQAMQEAVNEIAKNGANEMSKAIDDQLGEGAYEAECRKVIHSGNLYGTGVLKGPLGMPRMKTRWSRQVDGTWRQSLVHEVKPHFKATPIWNYYPDPLATEVGHCRYEFERHAALTKSDVVKLKSDPSYMADRIDEVLKRYPAGNVQKLEQWEADLRSLSTEQNNRPDPINRFEMLERWGAISGAMLIAAGLNELGLDPDIDYEAQCWLIGGVVIRVDINPYDTGSRPFKLFYFDKDESSIWGEGIMSIMRHTESGANTSLRAAVDNAAMTAVPNLEVNSALMPNEADLSDFSSGRVWVRTDKGPSTQYAAVRVLEIPNKTGDFIALLKLFMELGDEVSTIPRFTYGNVGGEVSKTVGGLSMLLGQSNISLKDLAKSWDNGITEPFIGDMYQWNMQFNPRREVKGDYSVIARGSSSLVAKEIRSNALAGFTADLLAQAPNLAKVRDLFEERARNLDLDPDLFLKTQEEADADNQELQMGKAAMATVDTISKAMGMDPMKFMENADQLIAELSALAKNTVLVPAQNIQQPAEAVA